MGPIWDIINFGEKLDRSEGQCHEKGRWIFVNITLVGEWGGGGAVGLITIYHLNGVKRSKRF